MPALDPPTNVEDRNAVNIRQQEVAKGSSRSRPCSPASAQGAGEKKGLSSREQRRDQVDPNAVQETRAPSSRRTTKEAAENPTSSGHKSTKSDPLVPPSLPEKSIPKDNKPKPQVQAQGKLQKKSRPQKPISNEDNESSSSGPYDDDGDYEIVHPTTSKGKEPHQEPLNDEPPKQVLHAPDTTTTNKPGSKSTTIISNPQPLKPSSSPSEEVKSRNSTNPRLGSSHHGHGDLEDQVAKPGPPPGLSASTYAAATAGGTVASASASASTTAPIYDQRAQIRDQSQGQAPNDNPSPLGEGEQMDVDFQNHVSGDREGIRGPGEMGGYGTGVWNGVANVLGLRSGPSPPMPKFSERDVMKLIKENNRLQEDLYKTQRNLEKYSYELQKSTADAHAYYRRGKELHQENVKLNDQVQGLEHELMNVAKKYEDAKALSDTRGKELVGAQVFLNKADSLSISDLVGKVNTLNEEIFQAAASLGEALGFSKYDLTEEDFNKRAEFACGLVGKPLVQLVHSEGQKPEATANPLIVQITLQVYLTAFCANRITTWAPADRNLDKFVRGLYKEIRANSDQAVSGRWRALTRAQLKTNPEKWGGELEHDLLALLSVASWNATPDQRASFVAKLPAIFKAVEDVKISLSEKFTSADIEIASIPYGTPFNKSVMEETYGDDAGTSNDIVAGTTGLGLTKVVFVEQTREVHLENVLSPKIVLESSLKAALEPPPPRARKSKTTKRI